MVPQKMDVAKGSLPFQQRSLHDDRPRLLNRLAHHIAPIIAVVLSFTPTYAGVVNLLDLPVSELVFQSALGQQYTDLYAQSIVASGTRLDDFAFYGVAFDGDLNYSLLVTGARSINGGTQFVPQLTDIRYDSGLQTLLPSDGARTVSFAPMLPVRDGERLFVVFDTYSHPADSFGYVLSTKLDGTDHYQPGEFLFLNTHSTGELESLESETWTHRGDSQQDLAVRFQFSTTAVPEPSSIWLVALTVFASTSLFQLVRRAKQPRIKQPRILSNQIG